MRTSIGLPDRHTRASDDELLSSGDIEAFGVFYARHLPGIRAYFTRRMRDGDAAEDLVAETFASALAARRRFTRGSTPAAGWLYTIAARRFVDFQRRQAVGQRVREAAAGGVAVVEWPQAPSLHETAVEPELLRHLPTDQRRAIVAHVVEGRAYGEIAQQLETSQASIRQRVSRGLRTLRSPLVVYRAAQQLAREDRAFRHGGGHGASLAALAPSEPLDCSSSASLILLRSGLFEPGPAWVSGRLADGWGHVGEGRYFTVWANAGHVLIEFTLDSDHSERFDPTPSRLAPHSGSLLRRRGPLRDFTPRHWPGL